MSKDPNVNDIKKWIKTKLENEKPLAEFNYVESSAKISDDLSKISESYNLSSTPLRDIISGKRFLRKYRKLLQSEILDWTLTPFLDKQTYFNKRTTEILSSLNSKQESIESTLSSLNSKQESIESRVDAIKKEFDKISGISNSVKETQENLLYLSNKFIQYEITRAFQYVLRREPDKKAMDYYTNEIEKTI